MKTFFQKSFTFQEFIDILYRYFTNHMLLINQGRKYLSCTWAVNKLAGTLVRYV